MAPVSAAVSVDVLDSVLASQRTAVDSVSAVSDMAGEALVGDSVGDWDLAGAPAGVVRGLGIHSALVRLERIRLTAATTTIRQIPTRILRASATTRIMGRVVQATTQTIPHCLLVPVARVTPQIILRRLLLRVVPMHPIHRTSGIPIGTPA